MMIVDVFWTKGYILFLLREFLREWVPNNVLCLSISDRCLTYFLLENVRIPCLTVLLRSPSVDWSVGFFHQMWLYDRSLCYENIVEFFTAVYIYYHFDGIMNKPQKTSMKNNVSSTKAISGALDFEFAHSKSLLMRFAMFTITILPYERARYMWLWHYTRTGNNEIAC